MKYVLGERTAARLKEVLSEVDGPSVPSAASSQGRRVCVVRVTGEADGGLYPCVPTSYLTIDEEWEDYGDCFVLEVNGESLAVGTRYVAIQVGDDADGEAVFVTHTGCGCGCEVTAVTQSSFISVTATTITVPGFSDNVGALHVVVLHHAPVTDGNPFSTPAGWTLVQEGSFSSGSRRYWVGAKILTSDTAEDVVFTYSAGTPDVSVLSFALANAAMPEASAEATGTGATATASTVTSGGSRRKLIVIGCEDTVDTTPTAPTDMEAGETFNSTSRLQWWIQDVTGGATGTREFTLAGSYGWAAVSLVVAVNEGMTGTTWAGDVVVCGKVVQAGDMVLSGSGPPAAADGATGRIYFDVADANNPQFYFYT